METEGNNIRDLDAEELASLARRYYAARFPNPQRLGCPPPGEIINIVTSSNDQYRPVAGVHLKRADFRKPILIFLYCYEYLIR